MVGTMLRARHAVAALIIVAAASTPRSNILVHGAQETAAELAAALQRKYDGIKDFSADFTHAYEGGVLKKKITERGASWSRNRARCGGTTPRRSRSSSSPTA